MYSGYEVDDDWCVSVLQSYQADRDVSFPWSVGKPWAAFTFKRQTPHKHKVFLIRSDALLMLPGEDMTLEGRRQLALFLVRKSSAVISVLHLRENSYSPVWLKGQPLVVFI